MWWLEWLIIPRRPLQTLINLHRVAHWRVKIFNGALCKEHSTCPRFVLFFVSVVLVGAAVVSPSWEESCGKSATTPNYAPFLQLFSPTIMRTTLHGRTRASEMSSWHLWRTCAPCLIVLTQNMLDPLCGKEMWEMDRTCFQHFFSPFSLHKDLRKRLMTPKSPHIPISTQKTSNKSLTFNTRVLEGTSGLKVKVFTLDKQQCILILSLLSGTSG